MEVADNLHLLAIEQWEKINSNSDNSSQPPSNDNPFKKQQKSNKLAQKSDFSKQQKLESKPKRKPGRQKRSKGFGRSQILKVDEIILHYPHQCSACNQSKLVKNSTPYMGH